MLFKSMLQAILVAGGLYFVALYAYSQGIGLFAPAFYSIAGFFIIALYFFANYAVVYNWE